MHLVDFIDHKNATVMRPRDKAETFDQRSNHVFSLGFSIKLRSMKLYYIYIAVQRSFINHCIDEGRLTSSERTMEDQVVRRHSLSDCGDKVASVDIRAHDIIQRERFVFISEFHFVSFVIGFRRREQQ